MGKGSLRSGLGGRGELEGSRIKGERSGRGEGVKGVGGRGKGGGGGREKETQRKESNGTRSVFDAKMQSKTFTRERTCM